MRTKRVFPIALITLLGLAGCSQAGGETQLTAVQKVFEELKKNNFTMDVVMTDYSGKQTNQRYYFTSYAFQEGDGDTAVGVAQGDDAIFKYTLKNDQVVSSSPVLNSNTGTRYDEVYDYVHGVQDLDASLIPSQAGADGYINYDFESQDKTNNDVLDEVFLRWSSLSAYYPEKLIYKVVNDTLVMHSDLMYYDADPNNILTSTADVSVYNIGTTEIPEVKAYLDAGKGAKDTFDSPFFKTMNYYFNCNDNYTVVIDGTEQTYASPFKTTEYAVTDGYLDETSGEKYGALTISNAMSLFSVQKDADGREKLVLNRTPQVDESNFYTSVFGDYRASWNMVDFTFLTGYKDDDGSYYITDSQFMYSFANIMHLTLSDELNSDYVRIEIDGSDATRFKATMNLYNKKTMKQYGTLSASFSNPGTTKVQVISDYLSLGKKASTQSKDELIRMLDKFKQNNYSQDTMTDVGMAKSYFTSSYFYQEPYSPEYKGTNTGFLKDGDKIYSFSVSYGVNSDNSPNLNDLTLKVNKDKDYAKEEGTTLPGVGSTYNDINFAPYVSTLSADLYNYDQYQAGTLYGEDTWLVTAQPNLIAVKVFNYLYGSTSTLVPQGLGVSVDEDLNKLSILSFGSSASDASVNGYTPLTYYDIGTTKNELLEQKIAAWIAQND